jgi:putative transposase
MCQLVEVSRAGFYRHRLPAAVPREELVLRDAVQRVALEWPAYGSRRITHELQQRGWTVNRKRVQRIMRGDNLLCLRHRKFVVTTDSKHDLPVYPNLAKSMVLTGIHQLWRADITYIRLAEEFVYLAVILDAYSRRVIGWALDRSLEDSLTLMALEMALAQRGAPAGLVHHSDRGVQYASRDYTRMLEEHGIRISMSRTGNPWDNAVCESFLKTLKYEEVYRSEYRDLADAYARIGEFLEVVYNQKRLHSALDYRSPAVFEQWLLSSPALVGVSA